MQELLYKDIIKSYDIRGVWEQNLLPQDIDLISRCLANYTLSRGGKAVCVGRDGRASSKIIYEIVCNNFIKIGIDIIALGLIHTPMLYLIMNDSKNALNTKSIDGITEMGLMITGSHNPPDHNGIKIMLKDRFLEGADIKRVVDNYLNQEINSQNISKQYNSGTFHDLNLTEYYITKIVKSSKISDVDCSNLKIAWDLGGGAIAVILPTLLSILKTHNILINELIDCKFSGRSANPIPENLSELCDKIMSNECDFGFAFDGDGDRIVMVMNDGRILTGGELLYIIACDMKNRIDHLKVIVDIKMSQKIIDRLKSNNIDVTLLPSGHSIIKNNMSKQKIILAGEMSGHIYCAEDYYYIDDPLLIVCKVIRIHQNDNNFIRARLGELGVSYSYEGNIKCSLEISEGIIFAIGMKLINLGIPYCNIDGIRCVYEWGYWLVRNSNTEDILMIHIESDTQEKLYKIWLMVYKLLLEIAKNWRGNDLLLKVKNMNRPSIYKKA